MNKHTSLPWEWKQNKGNNIYKHSVYANHQTIAELDCSEEVRTSDMVAVSENIKANARLIVTAVNSFYELLDTLEDILFTASLYMIEVDGEEKTKDSKTLLTTRSVIAKVKKEME